MINYYYYAPRYIRLLLAYDIDIYMPNTVYIKFILFHYHHYYIITIIVILGLDYSYRY